MLQRRTPLRRKQSLRPRSRSEAARRRREALAEAVEQAKAYWGERCLVTGSGWVEWHHAYPRSTHPQWRTEWWNLLPLSPRWHRLAQRPSHWLYWACREIADELRAYVEGRRPPVTWDEAREILRRHQEQAEQPWVSPMGRAD